MTAAPDLAPRRDVPRLSVPAEAPRPSSRLVATAAGPEQPWTRGVGVALCLLALGIGGFVLYLLAGAGIAEGRLQENLFKTYRGALADGVAPVGPVAAGEPVGILEVPRLGLRAVVVEGTTAGSLLNGPGHRRDTPLPGQPGAAVVLGRRSLAGAPFADLDQLRPGDSIIVTTGQTGGLAYRVTGTRDSRDPVTAAAVGAASTLSLITADPPLRPTHSLIVTAALQTLVQAPAGPRPALGPEERSLHGDGDALLGAVLWGQLLVLVTVATTWLYVRWHRWPAWVVTTPVLLAVLWNVYEDLARLLPNTL